MMSRLQKHVPKFLKPALRPIYHKLVSLWIYRKIIYYFHPSFTEKEKNIIRKYNLESLKILNKKFKLPPLIKYDFLALKFRSTLIFEYLLSQGIPLKGKNMLDFGAGTGENLVFSKEYGIKKAIGLDYSSKKFNEFIKKNIKKNLSSINYIQGNVHKKHFEDGSFDLIISINSFEHFRNPKTVLKEIWRVCKVGGYVYIKFGPLFYSPLGAHRYGYVGIPYIQNIFTNEVVFGFFYNYLNINHTLNRYTREKITKSNLYPEMNKWRVKQFESLFLGNCKWKVIEFKKEYDYSFEWFTKMFPEKFNKFTYSDLFVSKLNILLKKIN